MTNNTIANSLQNAIYLNQRGKSSTSITLNGVTVAGNVGGSDAVFSDGGSAYTTVVNSIIANNQTGNAAIRVNSGGVDVQSSTVTGNKSTAADQKAGGVTASNFGTFVFTSGALYGNQNSDGEPSDVYADNGYVKLSDATQMAAEGMDFSHYVWNKNGDTSKTAYPNQANYDDTVFYAEEYIEKDVAQIGNQKFVTVDDAVEAATDGDELAYTITLIGEATDAVMSENTPSPSAGFFSPKPYKTTTFDLNGHNLATESGDGVLIRTVFGNLVFANTSEQPPV